jgi:hypothetical protein
MNSKENDLKLERRLKRKVLMCFSKMIEDCGINTLMFELMQLVEMMQMLSYGLALLYTHYPSSSIAHALFTLSILFNVSYHIHYSLTLSFPIISLSPFSSSSYSL